MNVHGRRPKVMLAMSELFTLVPPAEEHLHLEMTRVAEAEGIDAVFVSEHVVMGSSADSLGEPEEPRDWVRPGMQDPATPWPSPLIKLAAMAGATSSIRVISAALIAPLRHPILVAKDLATLDLISQGRLTVLPTVSWHKEEYASLGVEFETRGRRLDEHLEIWQRLWQDTPAEYSGEFYSFADTYFSPKPPSGKVKTWFGGGSLSPKLLRRIRTYADGVFLGFPLSEEDKVMLDTNLRTVGRTAEELEVVGWVAPLSFPEDGGPADIRATLDALAPQRVEEGCDMLAIKPACYIDKLEEMEAFCRQVTQTLDGLFPNG